MMNKRSGPFGRIWVDDEGVSTDDRPMDSGSSLASLGYLRGAIRRGIRLWIPLALVGLLLGVGAAKAREPAFQASTTIVLNVGPESAPGTAIQNEQVLASSIPVAERALKMLKLPEDLSTFQKSYTVVAQTDQALMITASAPSSKQAVQEAGALKNAFLAIRASHLKAHLRSYFKYLNDTLEQQKRLVATLKSDVANALAASSAQETIAHLRSERDQAISALATMVQDFPSEEASQQQTTGQELTQNQLVNPAAPVVQSRHAGLKRIIVYSAIGLIAGLVLGLGIVIVRALVSDRLRRREDIAYALNAPVRLSVGRAIPRRSGRRAGLSAIQGRELKRIVAHVLDSMPRQPDRVTAVAIVSVDSALVAALSAAGVALSCAARGSRVLFADLMPGSPAARLIDTGEPGVRVVDHDGSDLVVVVPDPDELPIGPLDGTSFRDQPTLAKAARWADLLISVVELDPATGGDHLGSWAKDAIAVITAGRSSATKVHAASEMVRLGGTRLLSAIVVGADADDESLGLGPAPSTRPDDQLEYSPTEDGTRSLTLLSETRPADRD
jgi:capsular polysaccharide biosynthesis protein